MKSQKKLSKMFYKILLLLAFVFLFTKDAKALIPTTDIPNTGVSTVNSISNGTSASLEGKKFFDTILGTMLKRIGTQVALNMTQQVINWGSTGFKGNPFFVRDQESFFTSVADEQVEAFVNEISADETAFPYSRNISMDLITDQVLGNSDDFKSKLNFSLDETIGPNWQDFTEDDFSVGGWDGWMAYTQNDANNPVGAYLRSAEELENRVDTVKNTNQTELDQSGGFLSMKKCVQYKDGVDASGLAPLGEDMEEYLSSLSLSLGSDIEFNASDDCARYETVTPGTLIAAQLKQSVEAPLHRAFGSADTGNELLNSVSDLAAGLISSGITQLIGNITTTDPADTSAGGPGDNSAFQSTSDTFIWNTSETVDLEATPIYVGGVLIGVPSELLQTSIDDTQAELDTLMNSKTLLRSFPKETMELNQCLPGPDYKFAARMRDQYLLESKKIQNKSDNDTENGDEAQDQLVCFDGFMSQLMNDIKTALISGSDPAIPPVAYSETISCKNGDPMSFPFKNITSAPLIYDQVNRIDSINQDAASLDRKISSKIRTLALLQSIKSNIVAHPRPIDLSTEDSPENIELKNKLASQYVSIKSQIGRPDTIADAQSEHEGYLSDFTENFDNTNPASLISKCYDERYSYATYTGDFNTNTPVFENSYEMLIQKDNNQKLFCSWQYGNGAFSQTRGYNDDDFEFECSTWYRSSIADYLLEAF